MTPSRRSHLLNPLTLSPNSFHTYHQCSLRPGAQFLRNEARSLDGGGIWATGNSTVNLGNNVLVEANRAVQSGGGFAAVAASTITLGTSAVVRYNVAGAIGGGKLAMRIVLSMQASRIKCPLCCDDVLIYP